jgi:hypothetical protein
MEAPRPSMDLSQPGTRRFPPARNRSAFRGPSLDYAEISEMLRPDYSRVPRHPERIHETM